MSTNSVPTAGGSGVIPHGGITTSTANANITSAGPTGAGVASSGNAAVVGPAVVGPAVVGPAVVGPAVVGPAVVGPAVVGPAVVGPRFNGTTTSTTGPYDFTAHTGGQYTRPFNPFIKIQPFSAIPWQGRKPRARILTAGVGLGAIPAVCSEVGCTYAGYQDKWEYQQHHDLHHYEHVCPEARCAKYNAIFVDDAKLQSHHNESHKPENTKLPPFNVWCPECNMHFIKDWAMYNNHMARFHPASTAPAPTPQLRTKRD